MQNTCLFLLSIWGHRAGNPYQNPEDELFIKKAIAQLLNKIKIQLTFRNEIES